MECKNLTPFKLQCLTNFPFIDEDFDALTNYELMCKIIEYVNIKSEENTETLNNWFKNLDIDKEINQKLDEMAMSGELTTLISNYINPLINIQNENINRFELETNNKLNSFDTRLSSISNINPIPVESISDMTDTSKVYLLTTDGYWYYYDNEWIPGGLYQSTDVANNSIDILKLSSNLQSNFSKYYTLVENPLHYTNFYCKVDNNKVLFAEDANYCYDKYTLNNQSIYQVTGGINFIQVVGIVVADENNNVIYSSKSETGVLQSLFFKANKENLFLYVSYDQANTTNYGRLNFHQVYELDNIYLIDNFNFNPNLLNIYNNCYGGTGGALTSYEGAKAYCYNMQKGRSYTVNASNIYAVAGLIITNYNLRNPIYLSSEASVPSKQDFTYTWTATQDGLIIISTLNDTYTYDIKINQNIIEENIIEENILNNKTISCDGDSIMHGNGNISYYDLIINKLGMIRQTKNAVGGATIATGTQSNGVDRHWISESVLNINVNSDYILINGGFNDYANKVPIGIITETFTDNIDSTTFAGGMELLCRNLLNRFNNGQKILFVFNHNITDTWIRLNSSVNGKTFKDYYNIQIEVLKKYSIPYIDLLHESQLNTILDYYKNTYTIGDGVHPNTLGYNKYYIDKIISKLKEL